MRPYYEDDAVTIYHGDCREILPTLGPVDLVLTDPPYGIGEDGGDKMRYGPGRTHFSIPKHQRMGWDIERPSRECFGLLMAAAPHWIIFGGNYFADLLPPSPGWLYWDKRIGGDFSDGELIYTNRNGGLRSYSVHSFLGLRGGKDRQHPTQKPLSLLHWCIGFFPNAQTILDPFMGSGTTLRAAKDLGRRAIGIEIEERYCEIAAKRMSQTVMAFDAV